MPEMLPLSLLNDYLYCPRRAALKVIEGWRASNEHTNRGDIVHEHADLAGYEVVKGMTLLRALPVWSERLGLNGKCDIVEVEAASTSNLKSQISDLKSSAVALRPVEFKLGKRRRFPKLVCHVTHLPISVAISSAVPSCGISAMGLLSGSIR